MLLPFGRDTVYCLYGVIEIQPLQGCKKTVLIKLVPTLIGGRWHGAVPQVGDESDGKYECDGEYGCIQMLWLLHKCQHHCHKKHKQLQIDYEAVAASQSYGKIDEQRRCPQYIKVDFGTIMIGEEP